MGIVYSQIGRGILTVSNKKDRRFHSRPTAGENSDISKYWSLLHQKDIPGKIPTLLLYPSHINLLRGNQNIFTTWYNYTWILIDKTQWFPSFFNNKSLRPWGHSYVAVPIAPLWFTAPLFLLVSWLSGSETSAISIEGIFPPFILTGSLCITENGR